MSRICRKCGKRAIINLRQFNLSLCEEHFIDRFNESVNKAIKEFKMFSKKDKILLAVSGGKDSLALWNFLVEHGYEVIALYINLGIRKNNYSEISKKKVEKFAEERDAEFILSDFARAHAPVPEIARKSTRSACSVCGIIKRHEFDRIAYENNFDVLATGHNLDDEASTILNNILRWNKGFLKKQLPYLKPWHPKLKPKVKPLCYLTEKETLTYCLIKAIDFVSLQCPFSERATSITIKESLNHIEEHSPGTKLYFYKKFLEEIKKEKNEEEQTFAGDSYSCASCGFPSSNELCSFCALVKKVKV